MFEFLVMTLIVGALCLLLCAVGKALDRIATHMRGNPDATKAILEHVLTPLFSDKKEPEPKSPPGTAMVGHNAPVEEPSDSN